MENFIIRHHYKNDLESFLKKEAEILGEILAKALENNELIITEDKQA